MKRVLFLDDDRRRTEHFREIVGGSGLELVTVETAAECIAWLARETFDLVLLDHDLGGEIYCDSSREDCGMEVVRWLVRNEARNEAHNEARSEASHGSFIVHTHNEIAGAAMYLQLRAQGYDVVHATFGSTEFRGALESRLGRKARAGGPRRSIGDRIREYFRSLRLGR